ncbi:MAG: FixH family protein [Burkholderiaceae bacterium]|jgi:hypothetical protein|nr:FixH family protein [Burkholderiaceae bacterium]
MNIPSEPKDSQPWWSYGHLWMVIAGPLIVVVASFTSLYLAIRTPDPVYTDPSAGETADEVHAMQARNHAATGGVARKAPEAAASQP